MRSLQSGHCESRILSFSAPSPTAPLCKPSSIPAGSPPWRTAATSPTSAGAARPGARTGRDWQQPLTEDLLRAPLAGDFADDDAVRRALRRLRQRAMAHLTIRDLCGLAPLAEIVEGMTLLADVTTNFALDHYHRQLAATYGEPLDSRGRPQRLLVIGMGKLGGRELNVSSDVDYIFVYPEEGDTAGPKAIENYDFFNRLGKRIIGALGDLTADGQVFRVDMRLRPNGDSGPLVCSLDSLENYFITQGREWERYAWIKARTMNAGPNLQPEWVEAMQKIGRPFVFRKYLDFGAINAMRDLHAQIRREVARKDMADHVKLGPAASAKSSSCPGLPADPRRPRPGAADPATRGARAARRAPPDPAETNRNCRPPTSSAPARTPLQYVEDKQTHMLPFDPAERAKIAASMISPTGRRCSPCSTPTATGQPPFRGGLLRTRGRRTRADRLWLGQIDDETAIEAFGNLGFRHPKEAQERLAALRGSARYQQLPATNRSRLDAVGPRLIEAAAATPAPDTTLVRGLAFLEVIARRGAYLRCCSSNRWR
jgi:glutamate-ammonia-ligase adenylyltransferase